MMQYDYWLIGAVMFILGLWILTSPFIPYFVLILHLDEAHCVSLYNKLFVQIHVLSGSELITKK